MRRSRRHAAAIGVAATGLALSLAACTPGTSFPSASPAPLPEETEAEAPAAPQIEQLETDVTVEDQDSCAAVPAQGTVDGQVLGACYTEKLWAASTGSIDISFDQQRITGDFQLTPALALDLKREDKRSSTDAIYVDGEGYEDAGSGWIRGDVDSKKYREVRIGETAASLVALFAEQPVLGVIAACTVWNVDDAPRQVDLPNGEDVTARSFTCAEDYEFTDFSFTDATILVDEDFEPIGSHFSMRNAKKELVFEQYFFDLGKEVSIQAPL